MAEATNLRAGIPPEAAQRRAMMEAVDGYVRNCGLVPPLAIEELRDHASLLAQAHQFSSQFMDFLTVLVGNALWRDTVASVPFERRLLLVPQCLSAAEGCPAERDEFGLLCEECGRCNIGRLQAEAEKLGYVALVAEGTTVVTRLLQSGKVDAVIGVSCLDALERSFPHMVAGAVPGLAIPLLTDGCRCTEVDVEWVLELIRLRSDGPAYTPLDLDALRDSVQTWFAPEALSALLQTGSSNTESMAIDWLAGHGKRWRPTLTIATHSTITGEDGPWSETIRKIAVAVECFHKASLVHDDIEDEDTRRYGQPTLHESHGVPIALNIGDLLLGEGYRLISQAELPAECVREMLKVAAEGHRALCLGQGYELAWMRNPSPLSTPEVIDIFRGKTAPAFDVALRLGALAAAADGETLRALREFSHALGIAFQIRDDLEDVDGDDGGTASDAAARRPTLLLALAWEHADASTARELIRLWRPDAPALERRHLLNQLSHREPVHDKACQLLEHYRREAERALSPLQSAQLKSLLRRLLTRILIPGE